MSEQPSQKKSKGCSGAHVYMPHPIRLLEARCVDCGHEKRVSRRGVPGYNKMRCLYRTAANLQSLIAPITLKSSNTLEDISQRFQIASNTAGRHVTFAEGVTAVPESVVENIRQAMSLNNRVRVQGVNAVPTRRGGSTECLILLELEFCGNELSLAVTALEPFCKMAQYPLHCALGVTTIIGSTNTTQLLEQLQGKELKLNWSRMQALGAPPPPSGKCFRKLVVALQRQESRTATSSR